MTKPSGPIYFIGVGGIGMSGLARLHLAMGHAVQGSDARANLLTKELESLGAKIFIGHDPAHVTGTARVVYSTSISENHPERAEAVRRGIPLWHRSEALADLCRGKFTIAVTGTHGKTTTTSMIGSILMEDRRDPTIVVGGMVRRFGGNALLGQGREIVVEADESDSSFLNLSPDLEVITNIEEEHMDHFKSVGSMERAYRNFIARLPQNPPGRWIGCAEDARVLRLSSESPRPGILYGEDRAISRFWASDVQECPQGRRGIEFKVWDGSEALGMLRLSLVGRHNVLNALAATAAARLLEIPFETVARALENFEGAGRRFDVKYEDAEFLVVDDYAHHPTEIRKTLAAARTVGKKRVVALFQPHRYTRVESLMDLFKYCFSQADKLFLTDIYSAGETPRVGVNGRSFFEMVRRCGHPDVCFVEKNEAAQTLYRELRSGDLAVVMGAGDISQVAEDLAGRLSQRSHPASSNRGIFSESLRTSLNLRGKILENEPLSRHTTLKIGGPARWWVEPADEEDLRRVLAWCQSRGIDFDVFGGGSNVLAPDEGLSHVVIYLASEYFRRLDFKEGVLRAMAGVANSLFIAYGLRQGLGDFEFLLGIPGQIGGSVAMNAGSHGKSMRDILKWVRLMDAQGIVRRMSREEIPFSYRHSGLPKGVVLEAGFSLPAVPAGQVEEKMESYRAARAQTQDLQHASAGCLFKNPSAPGCSAGKLIEEAGLKGYRVGRAQISEKHANFLINLGGATSRDAKSLIRHAQETVKRHSGVDLETEVKIL